MPSANGVFSLVPGYLATTGTTILTSQHNPVLEDIAEGLTGRLSRDGTAPMTGPLKLASGSAAAPGMSFQSDTSTGLSKTTNGFGVSIGGVQVAEFTAGGLASGSRFIGELIDYSGTTAPALTVFPYGQTLSRTTYAALWAFAQVEIAAGSTFYNNGNGSTTFGIGDLRGRVKAAKDNMGGSAASRLTATYLGTAATVLGATGGAESQTLTLTQLPTGITSAGTLPVTAAGLNIAVANGSISILVGSLSAGSASLPQTSSGGWGNGTLTATGTLTSNNTSGAAHPIVQPTIVVNCLLFAGA